MAKRKQIKLEDVEWDGLLMWVVTTANIILPMERILNSRWFQATAKVFNKLNPCHSPEESWMWGLMCFLFPSCWCCAGLRGFFYGVTLMGIVMVLIL